MTEDKSSAYVTATVELSVFEQTLKGQVRIPAAPVRPERMLPVFQAIADAVIQATVTALEKKGSTISCKKGCAACCRKLVPIARAEAHRISELLDGLPEPKRSEVRARFTSARQRLREAGLLQRLSRLDHLSEEEVWATGLEYFRHWITCPFLEQEACLIYADRPLACREYLVTSAAEHCFPTSTAETVARLNLPGSVSTAVASLNEDPSEQRAHWVPLILAPEWAARHSVELPLREGVELLREVLDRLRSRGES
jgi:Fe-S-cluster containining protein